jgi:hypothetical protein
MLLIQPLALALAAIMLVASGCGGSSKTDSTAKVANTTSTATTATTASTTAPTHTVTAVKVATGKPLTHAQLIAAGDAICAQANTKRRAVVVITPKDLARNLPQIAIYDNTETNELGELVPPASMAHQWAQILADFQAVGEYVSNMSQYAQANNLTSVHAFYVKAEASHEKAIVIAKQAGFKRCSRGI